MAGSVKEARLGISARLLRGVAWLMIHTVQRPQLCTQKPTVDGPAIFVCRHVGLIDPVVLMVLYYRKLIHPLVAKDYYDKNRFTRAFYPLAQCYPIDRRNVSTSWLSVSLEALEKGESIIIFPEGRRNKEKKPGLLPFQNGAALLAAHSGAPLVPVYNAFWKFPHRYRLAVGQPFRIDPAPPEGPASAWLTRQTETIQSAVAALAPLVDGPDGE